MNHLVYKYYAMLPKRISKRRYYPNLGRFLREARKRLIDDRTGKPVRVEDLAKLLGVSISFVYQVEQGIRKPKNGQLGKWASIYGVRHAAIWKCLGVIPMDFVKSIREEPEPFPEEPFVREIDPFTILTEEEKAELQPFLDFVRWKINQPKKA